MSKEESTSGDARETAMWLGSHSPGQTCWQSVAEEFTVVRSLLEERLEVAEDRLRRLCMQREEDDEAADSPPGLITDTHSWPGERRLEQMAADGDRLARVAAEFGLGNEDTDLLVTCVLPEISPACGTACRYLSGLSTSRPTVAVVLAANNVPLLKALARGLLREGSSLLQSGLVTYENPEAPFPDRVLNVPDQLLDYLAENDTGLLPAGHWLRALPAHSDEPVPGNAEDLGVQLVADPHRTRYLRQGMRGEAFPAVRTALATAGRLPLLVDADALASCETAPAQLAERAALEARLLGAAVVMPVPVPGSVPPEQVDLLQRFITRLDEKPVPLLLYGSQEWAAYQWDTPLTIEIDLRIPEADRPGDRLGPKASVAVERIHRTSALLATTAPMHEVWAAARQRSAADLGALARHIVPEVGWDDLVLPGPVRERLDMLVGRVRHRDEVFRTWTLRRGGGRGRGTTALFAGESGTGKTMAAEAMAKELGLELFVVSLPSIVSKYIGETEKNLERVFSAAETLDAVVLFDEADSMFAKRGEVRGANDRHANMQSGYLLQRLEAFNGLAVLTTNLRSNIDAAFTRRFDEVIHFESPGPEVRALLWNSFLGDSVPLDISVDVLAQAYDLAGGSIRACVESAVFAAAAGRRAITGEDLLLGIETEYAKLGRLFGRVN
ncbi:ATP-binding protein [Streptomyces sp. NPDC096198]|uniref:ATP-binding protein n=1 Tax=Streptomyces sp. NPDC096198 TaxID=3366080 RepID=UPI00380B681D